MCVCVCACVCMFTSNVHMSIGMYIYTCRVCVYIVDKCNRVTI